MSGLAFVVLGQPSSAPRGIIKLQIYSFLHSFNTLQVQINFKYAVMESEGDL